MHGIKKRNFFLTQIDKLSIISLISSISIALISTIWAIYLESFLHNASYVGFLTTLFTVVAGISCIIMVPIIEKNSKTRIFMISLLLYGISYWLFSFLSNIYAIILLGLLIAVISTLKVTSFGIILRDKSGDKSVSKNISLIYTFLNISWLIGPLIAGFVSQEYGIGKVFIIAAIFMFISFILFASFRVVDNRTEKKIDTNILKLLKDFLKTKDRLLIYVLSGAVNFWWALIYIYIPIYIIESGLKSSVVGYFLFAVVIPLILFEYYFGKLTAKVGFKKIFLTGYILLSIFALSCFFISNIYVILLLLVCASIGAAMVEPTTEAYFFDIITKDQRDKYYGPYNTAIDVGNSLATFFGAIILLFLPFKFIFIFFAVSMFIFAMLSLKIKNVIEARKK